MNHVATNTVPLRKGSKGILGTLHNADHHAKNMLPFIYALREPVKHLGFETHREGHNVHEFVTTDGRRFTLRGITRGVDEKNLPRYVGIRLSLRPSHRVEYRLLDIESLSEVPMLLTMMANLARPQIGRDTDLMNGCGSN